MAHRTEETEKLEETTTYFSFSSSSSSSFYESAQSSPPSSVKSDGSQRSINEMFGSLQLSTAKELLKSSPHLQRTVRRDDKTPCTSCAQQRKNELWELRAAVANIDYLQQRVQDSQQLCQKILEDNETLKKGMDSAYEKTIALYSTTISDLSAKLNSKQVKKIKLNL